MLSISADRTSSVAGLDSREGAYLVSQKRIIIRPLRLSDADDIYELMHMPNVLWGTSLLPSITVDTWHTIIEAWETNPRMHVFVAEINDKVIGATSLTTGEGRSSHVGEIALVVHDAHTGQGIGKMLLLTVIDLADNWLNLHRLEIDVYTDNERAIRLYKQFDFDIEGRKRLDAFRGGNYIDSYIMARLRPPAGYTQAKADHSVTQLPEASEPKQ